MPFSYQNIKTEFKILFFQKIQDFKFTYFLRYFLILTFCGVIIRYPWQQYLLSMIFYFFCLPSYQIFSFQHKPILELSLIPG